MKSVFAPKSSLILLGLIIFMFSPINTLVGQNINSPIKQFVDICASSSYKTYTVKFNHSGFPIGTNFTVEMSDANGFFDTTLTPIIIKSTNFTATDGTISFDVPSTIAGKNYSLRIKSTNYSSIIYSTSSSYFNAYYWLFNDKIKILDDGSGALSICGTSGKLSIDPTSPSPLQFSSLKYIWRKDEVIIPNETNSELTVTTPGKYRVEVDYGKCNNNFAFLARSQDVMVSFSNNTNIYTISSSLPTSDICPANPTTLSTTAGQNYQWYLNGSAIKGATSYKYVTAVPGTYKVVVSPGTACQSTSNEITIVAKDFSTNINDVAMSVDNIYYSFSVKEDSTLDLTATTSNTINPTFSWLEPNNNTPVTTTNSISLINKPKESKPLKSGIYTLKVTTNDPACTYIKIYKFNVKSGVESVAVPNLISPNDQNGENDFWILPQEYKGSNIEVLILDAYGKEVFKTFNYQDNWPKEPIEFKSVNPIFYYIISKDGSPIKKGSLTVLK